MELIAVIFMVFAGVGLAVFVLLLVAIARRESVPSGSAFVPERDALAASLLFHVVSAGGVSQAEALRQVRRASGLAAPVSVGIDVGGWAGRYGSLVGAPQREQLLELAVQLAAAGSHPVPLLQYVALLDLSFGLGFHADALARLRERYHFEYVDPAKEGRPRDAGRGGHSPLFERGRGSEAEWLAVLGVDGPVTRQSIIAAYRRIAAQTHPDRFHEANPAARDAAAARFIEVTRAYEALLAMHAD